MRRVREFDALVLSGLFTCRSYLLVPLSVRDVPHTSVARSDVIGLAIMLSFITCLSFSTDCTEGRARGMETVWDVILIAE